MRIDEDSTDQVVLAEIGERLARLRLDHNLTQAEVAKEAGISKITVERMEAGRPAELRSLVRVLRVLGELAGLNQLIPERLPSPIDSLRLRGRQRRRASGSRAKPEASSPSSVAWSWKDQRPPAGS
ncbi:MAG TPA: helix-turn-helix transcriptional regulator [Candidatus Dormibacteraeota bacterium]|nr:helix-turn-helix transcriptional regulator [Candidatus Dormibacteraeota bacterium]